MFSVSLGMSGLWGAVRQEGVGSCPWWLTELALCSGGFCEVLGCFPNQKSVMLKKFCCLFLSGFSCQARGRMWEVMIRELWISGVGYCFGFLVSVLPHSLFLWLPLCPCSVALGICPLTWQCQHGVHGMRVSSQGHRAALGALHSFCHLCFAVSQQQGCPSVH